MTVSVGEFSGLSTSTSARGSPFSGEGATEFCAAGGFGDATRIPTILVTMGATTITVGHAIGKANEKARNQRLIKSGTGPKLIKVSTKDMMPDMQNAMQKVNR